MCDRNPAGGGVVILFFMSANATISLASAPIDVLTRFPRGFRPVSDRPTH